MTKSRLKVVSMLRRIFTAAVESKEQSPPTTQQDLRPICVISFPVGSLKAANANLEGFLSVLGGLNYKGILIGGKTAGLLLPPSYITHDIGISGLPPAGRNDLRHIIRQAAKVVEIHALLLRSLVRKIRGCHSCIFYIGGGLLWPEVMMARLMGPKVIFFVLGRGSGTLKKMGSPYPNKAIYKLVAKISEFEESVCFRLSDLLVIESPSLLKTLGLISFAKKTLSLGAGYVNLAKFPAHVPFNARPHLIAFFGRLSEDKGVTEFTKFALDPSVESKGWRCIIIGDGPAFDTIKGMVDSEGKSEHVQMTGWLPLEKAADILSKSRIAVFPLLFEGLPMSLLQAMAAGSIVISTEVGGIRDIINHGVNGFLIKEPTPLQISNIFAIIETRRDLEQISVRARQTIEEDFSFKAAVARYAKLLEIAGMPGETLLRGAETLGIKEQELAQAGDP